MRTKERERIYDIIDEERDYQDSIWGGHNHNGYHEPESWIVYMEHYLNKAKLILSIEHVDIAYPEAMDNMRKAVALGVACMENYDTPKRNKKD